MDLNNPMPSNMHSLIEKRVKALGNMFATLLRKICPNTMDLNMSTLKGHSTLP